LDTDTRLGLQDGKNGQQPVCIPLNLRLRHTHVIGQAGTGKSALIEHMALHDVHVGHGVAMLDPDGSLVERLLSLIQRKHIDRVIYLNPGDADWIPLWNPLQPRMAGPSRLADALGLVFAPAASFGDRAEHILRQTLLAVLQLPNGNLSDALSLLRRGDKRGARLRSQVLRASDDDITRHFWRSDFLRYSCELDRIAFVLYKLLASGSCSRMLSQTDSSFDLRDIMDCGKILLLDLSWLSPEARDIFGRLMLTLLHLAAVGRRSHEANYSRPFHIYCDSAYRFVTDVMEDLMAETRRSNVSLTLAHQYMRQFSTRKADALSIAGSTVIFRVDSNDAQHLRKDLQGKVDLDELITLEVGQAVARIGSEVVRVRTLPPLVIPPGSCRDLIVQQSHERYYRPMR
jgi:hypothetical protein